MAETTGLSDAKRALLERYLRGEVGFGTQAANGSIPHVPANKAPLSFGQEQLWLLAHLVPNSLAYNECLTIHLPGPLDVAALQRGFNAFVARHAAWRTTFPIVDGQPVQLVHAPIPIELPLIDLSALPECEREAEAQRRAQLDAQQPFDLAQGPLLRPLLIRFSDTSHRLYLALHHIIFDGVAVYQVLLPELRALYESALAGTPSPLPDLPIEYTDYARWQRDQFTDEAREAQVAYWRRQLQDAPTSLDLPTDRPRPVVQSYHGGMHPFYLSQRTTAALKDLARREGVTLYMVLVAAFGTLLYRNSGQEDMLIGTATAGRTRVETQRLVGYFLNTLALRIDLSADPTFVEMLRRVRGVTVEAYDHDNVPFAAVVQALQPARTPSQNPIFQVMLSLEPPLPAVVGGWTLTQMDVHISKAKFDLSIELDDRPEGLIGRFEYSSDLFDTATISRMVDQWHHLLESIVADPSQRIAELGLMSRAERQRILVDWNATQSTYPGDRCVHRLFEEQVERSQLATALLCGERSMTYAELNERANQFANQLRRLGVAPGDCVAIGMDRSIEMVVGILAILKAGAAYVPLDPTYPVERLLFMLRDTGARMLVTQPHLAQRLPAEAVQLVFLDLDAHAYADQPSDNLVTSAEDVTSESRAYIMYTSGSTGLPKGVCVRHRGIARLVCGVQYAQLDATRTLMLMAPLTFDASTFELWGALLHGARCVILPKWIPTPRDIGEAIRRHGVTTVWLAASLFNAIIDEAPHVLVGIRQLLTGGEVLSVPHVSRALDLLPGTQLINGYGPTETTTFACCYAIPRQFSSNARSVPIGRPIANTQVYVLDRHMQPVPVGVPGELYIGGAGVAEGYLNRPELTSERFVPDIFSTDPAARLYRTGDAVRWLPDGNVEYIGRLDQQVKVRGFRVEPGEIEIALKAHAGVRETLVIAQEDQHASKRLVAYVVPHTGHSLGAAELRAFLANSLPNYMVPFAFVVLQAIPTMASGKVDRHALPAANAARVPAGEGQGEPTTPLQRLLTDVWEDLLDVRPIGIADSFFDLGGHSLLAARLVARLEQVYGVSVPLSDFYADPTIEHLASAWEHQSGAASRTPLVPVQPTGSKRPLFFLHGDFNGGGYYCWNLARYLGPDQPLYALEPYGLDGGEIPATVEAMATGFMRLLRTVQPHGPYLIAGYCNGALVAFELAQQLAAAGERIDLLALIDVSTASEWRRLGYRILAAPGKLMGKTADSQMSSFLRLRRVYRRVRYSPTAVAWFDRLERLGITAGAWLDRLGVHRDTGYLKPPREAQSPLSDVWGKYGWVTARYQVRSYSGKVWLLLPTNGELQRPEAAERRWRNVADDVAVTMIPGTHVSCVTTYGEALAVELTRQLAGQAPLTPMASSEAGR